MSEIRFDLPDNRITIWSTPKEFSETGKKLAVLNFERLSKKEGQTTARYVDNEFKTYRLTFIDLEKENKKRYLEIHARGFKDDLASCVVREFNSDSIPTGHPVLLRCYKEEKTFKNGTIKQVNRWDLKKVDEPIVTEFEIIPEPNYERST